MNFDPEAVREFEHAGWQRAAPEYADGYAVPIVALLGQGIKPEP